MAYKMKNSPLNQSIIGSLVNQQNQGSIPAASSMVGGILGANQPQPPQQNSIAANLAAQGAQQAQSNTGTIVSSLSGLSNPMNGAVQTGTTGTITNNVASLNNTLEPKVPVTGRVPAAASIIAPRPATVKPSRMQTFNPMAMVETPINPRGFSNSKAIQGVAGRSNRGTFTRTVRSNEGPMMQLANPDMLQDGPQLPPETVQTSVTPTLGFENN
jgi:hypothetical protein